jgi:hypothetical protein
MMSMTRGRLAGMLAAVALTAAAAVAGTAAAYPPKDDDWKALETNAGAVIAAWDQMDFVATYNAADMSDMGAFRATMKASMAGVNAACAKVRDQIGSGGLFGPELWTQGFRQTCWAMATFQKDFTPSGGDKLCGEARDALNFFKQYKPAKSPARYPMAAVHVTRFIEINETLKTTVRKCR